MSQTLSNKHSTVIVLLKTSLPSDAEFYTLLAHAKTQIVPCNASVGLDLECSLACGQEDDCGAFYVRNETGYSHGACVLVRLDARGDYKNMTNPEIVNSTSKYWYRL